MVTVFFVCVGVFFVGALIWSMTPEGQEQIRDEKAAKATAKEAATTLNNREYRIVVDAPSLKALPLYGGTNINTQLLVTNLADEARNLQIFVKIIDTNGVGHGTVMTDVRVLAPGETRQVALTGRVTPMPNLRFGDIQWTVFSTKA